MLLGARRLLAEERLVTRCAWCERYAIDGVWLDEREVPAFLSRRRRSESATHGICPRCLDDLHKRGLSA